MDESFDPYRKWLGIPPEEQPPHHYRLLGLEMFEANPDVIVNAADARMSFMRTLSTDQRADMAERIALQIKEAQACLIDPAKKAFYDGQLKRRIAALQKASPATPVAKGVAANHQTPAWTAPPRAASATPPTIYAAPALNVPAPTPVSRRNRKWTWPQTAGVLLGSIALVCVLIFVLGKQGKNAEANSSKPIAHSVPAKENGSGAKSESPVAKVESTPDKKAPEPASATGKENPPKAEGNQPSGKDNTSETLPKAGEDNPFEVKEDEPNNVSETNDPSKIVGIDDGDGNSTRMPEDDSTASKGNDNTSDNGDGRDRPEPRRPANSRRPIPDEAARKAADKTVREIYGQKIAAAKSSKDKRDLADQIRRKAIDTKGDTTALYALMTVAFQLAGESGQLEHASEYADWFARYFEVDAWELKADAAAKAVASARNNLPGVDGDDLLLDCKQLALEAKQAGQIEAAGKIAKAAIPLAKKDQTLFGDLNKLVRDIDKLKARYQPVRKALEKLKENPDDPDASALAGRWICFESRDWDKGLAMLAKSSDATLAKLAAKDIIASEDSSRRMEVADAWWDIAQREKNDAPYKPGMLARSEYWYRKALPTLSGLNKTKAETRLNSMVSADDAETSSNRGVVKTGNVALAKNGTITQGFRSNGFKLNDGNSENPGSDYQATYSPVPCEWTITFDKVYQLREIRFFFYNGDRRFYHYTLDVSADGENYKTVVERNQGQWFGRQEIKFPAQPVKSIKLYGTYSYNNRVFAVTEFEAYCVPPKQ